MAIVTGYTADHMEEIEAASIVAGVVTGDELILTRHDGTTIDAGNVRGPKGDNSTVPGPTGPGNATDSQVATFIGTAGSGSRAAVDARVAASPGVHQITAGRIIITNNVGGLVDVNGRMIVTHGLTVAPTSVMVVAERGSSLGIRAQITDVSPTTFRCQLYNTNTAPETLYVPSDTTLTALHWWAFA